MRESSKDIKNFKPKKLKNEQKEKIEKQISELFSKNKGKKIFNKKEE